MRVAALLSLAACAGAPEPREDPPSREVCEAAHGPFAPPEEEAAPPAADAVVLTGGEAALLAPFLEEVRAGVRVADAPGAGICAGAKADCERFVGPTTDVLPPGDYHLHAELLVPALGGKEAWWAELDTRCVVEGQPPVEQHRRYKVQYPGKGRTYRLSPLVRIRSPEPRGAESCAWTLRMGGITGPEREVGGVWSVPAP